MLIFSLLLVCVIGSYLTATLPKMFKCSIFVIPLDVCEVNISQIAPLASAAHLLMQTHTHTHTYTHTHTHIYIHGSQEECARLREGVLYVKVYRYNPKHLCPKLNGYGDNGQRSLKL